MTLTLKRKVEKMAMTLKEINETLGLRMRSGTYLTEAQERVLRSAWHKTCTKFGAAHSGASVTKCVTVFTSRLNSVLGGVFEIYESDGEFVRWFNFCLPENEELETLLVA